MAKKSCIFLKLIYKKPPIFPYILNIPLDLILLIDNKKFVDLSSLRVFDEKNKILLSQFSPNEEFNIEKGYLKGVLNIIINRVVKKIKIEITYGEKENEVLQLPYPFYTYRIIQKKFLIKKPSYFLNYQIIPLINDRILFKLKEKEIGVYNYSNSQPKPFFEKIIGPSGENIIRIGHPHDPYLTHTHHRGIWIGHASLNNNNFWEERESKNKINHQFFLLLEDGQICGRFIELTNWETKEKELIMREKREIKIYSLKNFLIIDFYLSFWNEENDILIGKTPFGFLSVRVAKSMSVFDGGGLIINSNGEINEKNVLWKRANWCCYSGPINEKEWNSITIFDNKGNPNYPTYWHCRNDGWFCASFSYKNEYLVKRREKLNLKYRIFIQKGKPNLKNLNKHFEFYNSYIKTEII
jgi:hypothetical protein